MTDASSGKSLAMMPWFPRDFIAATRHMTLAERGAYRDLLDFQWEMGRLPVDDAALARLLGVAVDEFRQLWPAIRDKFTEQADGLINERLEQHRDKALRLREVRQRVGSAGGKRSGAVRKSEAIASNLLEANGEAKSKSPSPSPSPSPESQLDTSKLVDSSDNNTVEQSSTDDGEPRELTLIPLDPENPPAKNGKRKMVRHADVQAVFDHWRTTHGHQKAGLDDKRKKLIVRALQTYTVDQLCESITGYLNSPHHMGDNDRDTRYDSIELFLRDAEHIDAGTKFGKEPPRRGVSDKTRKAIDNMSGWTPPKVPR